MAKKAKNYPVIPRDKRPQDVKRVGATYINTPVYTPKSRHADRLSKSSGAYSPNWISEDSKEFQGNDSRSGTKNPGWRQTIALGGDATSGYTRQVFKLKPMKYRIRSEDFSSISHGYGVGFGGMLTFQPDKVALEDIAIGRLRNKLKDSIGNAQLGPPLAESREIHRLVRQINEAGMKTFRALLAAKATKGKSLASQFGDIWLGYGFGINPMLQDIKSAADSVLHYVTRTDHRVVITGSHSRRYSTGFKNATSSSDAISAHLTLGWYLASNHWQGVRYRAGVDIIVKAGSNYSMADHLGLKVEALPSILWELTPYSWAVDYFTTVGSWLDDTFYTLPATVKYLSKNYKYECDTTATPIAIPVSGVTSSLTGGNSFGRYTEFTREKLAATLPTRSLRIKSVDEIASHGLNKVLNLASILAQRHGPKL